MLLTNFDESNSNTHSLSRWRCPSVGWSLFNGLLDGDLLAETLQWVFSLKFLKFYRCILVKELVDGEVAAAHLDLNFVAFDFNHDASRPEFVDTRRLAHKHDFELLPVGVVVDILGQLLVDRTVLRGDVHSDARL